jgi:hypothetical protein
VEQSHFSNRFLTLSISSTSASYACFLAFHETHLKTAYIGKEWQRHGEGMSRETSD